MVLLLVGPLSLRNKKDSYTYFLESCSRHKVEKEKGTNKEPIFFNCRSSSSGISSVLLSISVKAGQLHTCLCPSLLLTQVFRRCQSVSSRCGTQCSGRKDYQPLATEETVPMAVVSYRYITENALLNTILGWCLKQGTPPLGVLGGRGFILSHYPCLIWNH